MSYSISLEKEVTQIQDVYCANITFNVSDMAKEACIYNVLFAPDLINAVYARDILPFLKIGLKLLYREPGKFKKLEASNEWGTYEQFLIFVSNYTIACEDNPDAKISISK